MINPNATDPTCEPTVTIETARNLVQTLTPADVLCVYEGKPGCACGCRGKYHVSPEARAEAEARRGYAYEDNQVDTRRVLGVLRGVQAAAAMSESFAHSWFTATANKKVITVYLTKVAAARMLAELPTASS
jgi:hypothetical protein